jgi:REP element-mobilizing transposase RayT
LIRVVITNRPRRLQGFSYVGFDRYFLTTCTAFRRPAFAASCVASSVAGQLLHEAAHFEFAVLAYCLMPDHLHALLEAKSEGSDFRAFVKQFKQMTGFAHRQATGQALWQHGYHERVLRNHEASEAVARYIPENPVRAGLTKDIGEFPFAGSGTFDLNGLKTAWDGQT